MNRIYDPTPDIPMIVRASGARQPATTEDARRILESARTLSKNGRTADAAALVRYAGRIYAAQKGR